MSQVRMTFGAAGPQTSGVVFGGRITGNPFTYTAATEEYDGTNWTGGGSLGNLLITWELLEHKLQLLQ